MSSTGKTLALIFNIGCHPSLNSDTQVGRDYPGDLEDICRERYDAMDFYFLPGFTGDVRPDLRVGISLSELKNPLGFLYSLAFDRIRFAKPVDPPIRRRFAEGLLRDLENGDCERIEPKLAAREKEIRLPLTASDRASEVGVLLQRFQIGIDLDIVAVEGEVFAEYAHSLRRAEATLGRKVMPVSCANGMRGYLPTARAVRQGGYEVERSREFFAMPGRFDPGVEEALRSGIEGILREE
jgi:hypothetical protein